MSRHAHTTKAALLVALSLALAACGKQDEPPVVSAPAAASAPAFPTGNGAKTMTPADCDKLPDPKPADDSAAGRATAVSQGLAARADCKKELAMQQDKPNADLARIREIKEKEQADQAERNISEEEWSKRVKEGGSKPVRKLNY